MRPSEQWSEPTRGVAQVPGAERAPGPAQPSPNRAQAQVDLILRTFGASVGRGPTDWRETGVQYLFRESHLIVVDEYVDQVRAMLDGAEVSNPLLRGVTLVRVKEDALTALARVRQAYGSGVAAPDYVVSITGDAYFCPATEPDVVPGWTMPDPAPTADHAAGEGVRVVVIDTGLDPAASATHPWLTGVSGDPDPAIMGGSLGPYAGHGTFIAGIVRCLAPKAEVIVRSVFTHAGATFESSLVTALDDVLSRDYPDVISMSAGTYTNDATGPLGLHAFNETRLRHHKGVGMVVAASNEGWRQPFWPAAAPWTVSVGALASNWRSRASFSNFGGWVDVYAPGEDLINAFPKGTYTYYEPPLPRPNGQFDGMARWDGTSFSTPVVAGLIAARMSRTGENAQDAAAALLIAARAATVPGVGPILLPE